MVGIKLTKTTCYQLLVHHRHVPVCADLCLSDRRLSLVEAMAWVTLLTAVQVAPDTICSEAVATEASTLVINTAMERMLCRVSRVVD